MEMFIWKMVQNVINSSSSSSSDSFEDTDIEIIISKKKRKRHKKNEKYVINIVNQYSDMDFKTHFRLSRTEVENLLQNLNLRGSLTVIGRPPVPLLECVLVTIWILSTQDSLRDVGDRFGFSKGHTHKLFIKTCKIISKQVKEYIKWPQTQEEMQKTVSRFTELRGRKSFPNVIGCVDGTHIVIPGPVTDNSYYNRKGVHSILLQAICNADQKFIDVYCGWPGSVNDARVWQHSPIYTKLKNDGILPRHLHLLGDSAYPLDVFIMVPFRDNGHLTVRQRNFNKRLSSSRVVIEQAYGRLKGMFRRLKYLHLYNLEYAKYIIFAACILHNICAENDFLETNDEILHDCNDVGDLMENIAIPMEAIDKHNTLMQDMPL